MNPTVSTAPIPVQAVTSSQIAAIGHDLFEQFKAAPSAGEFFYAQIRYKKDEFPFIKIRDGVPNEAEQQAA